MEFGADKNRAGRDPDRRLDGLHVEKLVGGPLNRQQTKIVCAEFCFHFRVDQLVVQGAKRTTGRSAGDIPGAIVFEVPK